MYIMPTKIVFKDHPEFRPNLTPKEIFTLGSFGGTYWRPIYSSITNKSYKNAHKKYKWNISQEYLTSNVYNKNINKYKVKVGTTLEYWEKKGWITKYHPYGWVQWYCDFYNGKRTPDDTRQIKRWLGIAGPKGRFRLWLINKGGDSPKIRQTLQHWAYRL